MSFQAYLDNIHAKTGKSGEALAAAARGRGLSKPGEIIAWLKADFGLGHGHAMAVVALMRRKEQPARSDDEAVAGYFSGSRAKWRAPYDALLAEARGFGPDVAVSPAATYLGLTRAGRKFAVVQASGQRMDVGIKLEGEPAAGRFEQAGAWNAMVTHRVRVTDHAQLDGELKAWLKRAYDAA